MTIGGRIAHRKVAARDSILVDAGTDGRGGGGGRGIDTSCKRGKTT